MIYNLPSTLALYYTGFFLGHPSRQFCGDENAWEDQDFDLSACHADNRPSLTYLFLLFAAAGFPTNRFDVKLRLWLTYARCTRICTWIIK
jgi:hypothetical protein